MLNAIFNYTFKKIGGIVGQQIAMQVCPLCNGLCLKLVLA